MRIFKNCCLAFGFFCLFMAPVLANGEGYYPHWLYVYGGAAGGGVSVRGMELRPSSQPGNPSPSSETEAGASFLGGLGFKFQSIPIGFDLEFIQLPKLHYNHNDVISGNSANYDLRSDMNSRALFLNMLYDFHLGSDYFVPFVTAGGGVARNKVEMTATDADFGGSESKSATKSNFVYQLGLGIHIKLTDNVFFDLGYRHMELGRAQWGPWSSTQFRFVSNDVTADVGYLTVNVFFGNQHADRPPSLIND